MRPFFLSILVLTALLACDPVDDGDGTNNSSNVNNSASNASMPS